MMPIFPWLVAYGVLNGPRAGGPIELRDVVLEHLAWARRAGGHAAAPEAEVEAEEAGEVPADELEMLGEEAEPLDPSEVPHQVMAALDELAGIWEADVLGSVPSQLLHGLAAVADRGHFLLLEAAPDLASGFERLKETFMRHAEGTQPLTDDAFMTAVDQLVVVLQALVERASERASG